MGILSRYIAREVVASTALVFTALLILFSFFDLIHELADLGKGSYNLAHIFLFVLLSMPSHVYELFPIAALIGALYAMTVLAASSEITVMRVSGMSMAAMAGSLLRVGIVFVIVTFVFGEVVVPLCEKVAHQRRLQAMNSLVATQFRSGLWVKDDKSFINIQEMMPDTTLLNLKVYEFDSNHRLKSISFARRGEYLGKNLWRISDVEQTLFVGERVRLRKLAHSDWNSVLTPNILGVLLVVPEQMSIWSLRTYLEHLRENNQKTIRHEIALWSKMVYPFAIPVMLLLATPFSAYQRRSGGVGGKIFIGIMVGLGFHLLNRLFSNLGVLNDWNPIFSTVTPSLLFLFLALGAMYRVERR